MRVEFKLDSDPDITSVFEAGLISKEPYKDQWVLTYANLNCKDIYHVTTIVPTEFTADCFIEKALCEGYIDVSGYKSVKIEELLKED